MGKMENISDYRLLVLQSRGYVPDELGATPIKLYHKLNPQKGYNPTHLLCYVMLYPNGRLVKSHYSDNWEIEASDREGFETFVTTTPRPISLKILASKISRMIPPAISFENDS